MNRDEVGADALARALAMSGLFIVTAERASGRVTAQSGRLSGWDALELKGGSLEAALALVCDPEDHTALSDALDALRGRATAFEAIARMRLPDGNCVHVRWRAEALDAARLVLSLERTEAPSRGDRLTDDDAAKLQAIVQHAPDAIYVRNLEGRFLLVNPAGLAGLGLTADDVLGRRPEEVMPPPIAQRIQESDQEVLASGEMLTYEATMQNMEGRTATYLVSKYLYRSACGEAIGLIGILRDITELKGLQMALAEQNRQLQHVDRRKSEFVSSLSHELRTPLTFIKGYVEFLEDLLGGPLTPTQAEYVSAIQLGVERLERLVNDMLDFARLDAGTFKLVKAPVDLRQTVRSTTEVLQPMLDQAQVRVRLALDDAPLAAEVDAQRIGQVVTNLLSNAIKFSPKNGTITVRAHRAAEEVVCEVIDEGPGIAPEDAGRLFKRFSQLGDGPDRGGLGLGLSIAKALVEAHGGRIGVRSRPGEGATFWFSLPAS